MPQALVRYEPPAHLSSRRAIAAIARQDDLNDSAFWWAELQLGHSLCS
jgi:hypothetical protein